MKHIKTASANEVEAKKKYATPDLIGFAVADKDLEDKVERLYKLTREADENALEMSRLRGDIMNAMKEKAYLKNKDGVTLCTWLGGNTLSKVDWDQICEKYNVSSDDIRNCTTTTVGSRRFSIEIGG